MIEAVYSAEFPGTIAGLILTAIKTRPGKQDANEREAISKMSCTVARVDPDSLKFFAFTYDGNKPWSVNKRLFMQCHDS